MAVYISCSALWCPQIVMLYIEGALFQHLSTGIERVAACYHVSLNIPHIVFSTASLLCVKSNQTCLTAVALAGGGVC